MEYLRAENLSLKSRLKRLHKAYDELASSPKSAKYNKSQSNRIREEYKPNTLAIPVTRIRVAGGGYRAVDICVLVKNGKVISAIDENGFKTGITYEESVIALCKSNNGQYKPPKQRKSPSVEQS